MSPVFLVRSILVVFLLAFALPSFGQSKILINEYYRSGTCSTGNEWFELLLTETLTEAELEAFFVGDSNGNRDTKNSSYRFTNMQDFATEFPAGTIIVVSGTTGVAEDLTYDPDAGDWNLVLRTNNSHLTAGTGSCDLANTDVAWVDTSNTSPNPTLSSDGFAIVWGTPKAGILGLQANVAIAADATANNNFAVALNSDNVDADSAASWTLAIPLANATPGEPNGGANSTYIASLRNPSAPAPTLSIAATDASKNEGNAGTTPFTFTVTRADSLSGTLTADYAVTGSGGNPANAADFAGGAFPTGVVSFADSESSQVITVDVSGDTTFEQDEGFTVTLSNPSAGTITTATATGTILNDDAAPANPTISIDDVSLTEGDSGTTNATFTLSIDLAPVGADVVVDYATADDTAMQPGDYTTTTGQATFVIGSIASQIVNVPVVGDCSVESPASESFRLNLSLASGTATVEPFGTATITDNDQAITANIGVAPASANEGNSGTNTRTVTVSLTSPMCAGQTFTYSIADSGDATEGVDYATFDVAGQTISGAATSATHTLTINGDTDAESNETVTLTLSGFGTNVALGTTSADATIVNDDLAVTPIGTVQGDQSGDVDDASPFVGQTVMVEGIVTARNNSGFFLQDAGDGNANTSDGIYVFKSNSAVAVGNRVRVTGPITEFFHMTQVNNPTNANVVVIDAGPLPLPAPVDLSLAANLPDAVYPSNLERFENMRVTIPEFTVTAPNRNKGGAEFYGVVKGMARPMREAGLNPEDTIPTELGGVIPATVPKFDNNTELLSVHNNLLQPSDPALIVRAGTQIGSIVDTIPGITGVMDYSFRRFRVLADPGSLGVANLVSNTVPTGTQVSATSTREFSVGAFNVQLLKETNANCDPNAPDDPMLPGNQQTICRKFQKVANAIVNSMNLPDIVALIEVGDFNSPAVNAGPALDALVTRVNALATAAGKNPQYMGVLTPESAVDQQTTGFLIKTGLVGGEARVQLQSVADNLKEYGRVDGADGLDNKMYCPDDGNPLTPRVPISNGNLLDRPPLVMKVNVHAGNGEVFPISVMNLHLKALSGSNINTANTSDANGDGERYFCADEANDFDTQGQRNRAKRQQGAEFVAKLVQKLQSENPTERLLLVGDMNAYEFNDGLADVMGTIQGINYLDQDSYADNTTVVPGDGADLVTRNLENLYVFAADPAEYYSYTFDGFAQQLDHEVANDQLLAAVDPIRVERPRINADFPLADEDDPATPLRSSDHDPVVAYFGVNGFGVRPSISAIGNQTTMEDTPLGPLAFTISDIEDGTGIECADVVGSSGTVAVVANGGVGVGGAAQSCTITLTPVAHASGTTQISLSLTDGDGDVGTTQFDLTVTPVNDAPTISAISDFQVLENQIGQASFAIADIDSVLVCSAANVSATSSDGTLLPVGSISFNGTPGDCIATLVPGAAQTGFSDVTITVNDGSGTATATASEGFRFTVIENDADNDGVADSTDNCPNTINPDQADADNDGTGDVCDAKPNDPVRIFRNGFED